MAFILSQSWETGGVAPAAERARFLPPSAADRSRRAGAILLTILVHAVLISLLLNRMAAPAAIGEAGPGDGPMTMLDLSDPGSPAPAPISPQAPPAAIAPASPVDSSAAEPMLPAEWTVSRLPPSASASAAPPAGARGSAADAGRGGGGLGGGGVYDPYAGAAPNRSGLDGTAPARSLAGQVLGFLGLESGGFALDEAALEEIRRSVARTLPGQSGTAEIVVRVSPTGMVLEADARGGSAAPRLRDALARALRGKRLFRGSADAARVVTLPVVRFG